jgi:hypothetical protein
MSLSSHSIFEVLVGMHIVTGSIGLITIWVPIAGRKGGINHRRFGRLFICAMLATGAIATLIALTTLFDPRGTHPHLADHPVFQDADLIRGIFGWMMLYLATLTANLAWQGHLCLQSKQHYENNRAWHNLLSQLVLMTTATLCAWRGLQLEQWMMPGLAVVGWATVATNLWFIFKPNPRPLDRVKEHIKALVGAGISVYTAFIAFGAVRWFPDLALAPGLWSIPLTVGLALIIYHQRAVTLRMRGAA